MKLFNSYYDPRVPAAEDTKWAFENMLGKYVKVQLSRDVPGVVYLHIDMEYLAESDRFKDIKTREIQALK